jgi:hypothetical protein
MTKTIGKCFDFINRIAPKSNANIVSVQHPAYEGKTKTFYWDGIKVCRYFWNWILIEYFLETWKMIRILGDKI